MSDETTQASTATPNAGAGQTAEQPNAGQGQQTQQAGQEQANEAAQPFATFPTEKAFNQRLTREARRQMNETAKKAGFDDWQHMSDALATLRQSANGSDDDDPAAQQPGTAQAQPAAQPAGPSEADRLKMAIQVGAKLNLPAALVGRLQGDTPEAMEADAQSLVALMQAPARPGIPGAPQSETRATFTRAQLSDPAFVRAHEAEIRIAHRDGRIVDS